MFMNAILTDRYAGISFKIANHCTESINEYVNVKEAEDGTKFKQMITDPDTKVRYQQFGHISDATDYLICEAFKSDYLTYQRGDISLISRSFGTGNNKESGKRL